MFTGPTNANILICGEMPGDEEIATGIPFSGPTGFELKKELLSAGIDIEQTFRMNLVSKPVAPLFYTKKKGKELGIVQINNEFPNPETLAGREILWDKIREIKPNLIILLGTPALWAFSGHNSIIKYRGSILEVNGFKAIPTFNPASVFKNYPNRFFIIEDLKRCFVEAEFPEVRKPKLNFIIRPSLSTTIDYLDSLKDQRLVGDIETSGKQISVLGISHSLTEGICIPFVYKSSPSTSYWSKEDEFQILLKLREVFKKKDLKWTYQNGLFDLQFFAKDWGFVPNVTDDTMIMQHVAFPGLKKSLDLIASLHCVYYKYWKDNSKTMDDDEYWQYNCDDLAYTWEARENLQNVLEVFKLTKQYEFQMRLFWTIFRMMLRGVRINIKMKSQLSVDLLKAGMERGEWFEKVLGYEFNVGSHKQVQTFFYEDLQIKKIFKKNADGVLRPTADDDALEKIKEKNPILKPFVEKVQETRSIGVFRSNFAEAILDVDDRMRCSYNITGTTTFRLSSSKNPWETGANLQTIPVGGKRKDE